MWFGAATNSNCDFGAVKTRYCYIFGLLATDAVISGLLKSDTVIWRCYWYCDLGLLRTEILVFQHPSHEIYCHFDLFGVQKG